MRRKFPSIRSVTARRLTVGIAVTWAAVFVLAVAAGQIPAAATTTITAVCPEYPTPACTGVPSGVHLAELPTNNGPIVYLVTTPNTVLNGVHIAGELHIRTTGVTIVNSQIDGVVANETPDASFVIAHSTIGPAIGCIPGGAAISDANYSAIGVLIRNESHGFNVAGSHVNIRDSFVSLCGGGDPGTVNESHTDGIQVFCPNGPCTDIVFDHNTVDMTPAPRRTWTFGIQLLDPNMSDVNASNNLLIGGSSVIGTKWFRGVKMIIHNNQIVDGMWIYYPSFGSSTCAQQDWDGTQIVTIDPVYHVTSVVRPNPCVN